MKELNNRQQAIHEYIKNNEQIKVGELLGFLLNDFNVDRRTVIRDLDFLSESGLIIRHGAGRGTYYVLKKHSYVFKTVDNIKYFQEPYDLREVKEMFNFSIFNDLGTSIFTELEQEKLINLHAKFQSNFFKYDSQTIINKEFERILIEFSWKSSQIEGNTYSLLSTELLIKENRVDETKTKEETQMILNHKDAFNEVLQNKDVFLEMSRGNIEYIHRLLTKKLGVSRNLRTLPVGITGTKYMPIDNVHQLQEAIEKMVELINSKDDFFEKAFLSLIFLSYIQAFEDGNKRTARMVSNAILLSYNSIPMSYRAVDEAEYKKASILFYEQNNLSYFKDIFIMQYEFAVNNYFR